MYQDIKETLDELPDECFREYKKGCKAWFSCWNMPEHLPFKRFASNAAFYYHMCISFFLFESFKYDMDSPVIKITWYAMSFRRKVLDTAGQIIRTGRRIHGDSFLPGWPMKIKVSQARKTPKIKTPRL